MNVCIALNARGQYVDNQPVMGGTQPDWFTVYHKGYCSRPVPTFSRAFADQFMARARELGLSGQFEMDWGPA